VKYDDPILGESENGKSVKTPTSIVKAAKAGHMTLSQVLFLAAGRRRRHTFGGRIIFHGVVLRQLAESFCSHYDFAFQCIPESRLIMAFAL
jgi:hypothetical protein